MHVILPVLDLKLLYKRTWSAGTNSIPLVADVYECFPSQQGYLLLDCIVDVVNKPMYQKVKQYCQSCGWKQ
jgi:hypothetical protein